MTLLLLFGCTVNVEGDEAGECSDAADNDRNGYFDCNDNGCRGSPDCEESDADTDTDTDADTDTDTDTDTDADVPAYGSYALEMVVGWTFPSGGFDACELVYTGTGDLAENDSARLSFFGPYTRTSTCTDHGAIESFFPWYDRSTNEAFVSFKFGDGTLDEWYADDAETELGDRAEWWMYDMAEPFDPEVRFARYSEVYTDPDGSFAVTYEVEVEFAE